MKLRCSSTYLALPGLNILDVLLCIRGRLHKIELQVASSNGRSIYDTIAHTPSKTFKLFRLDTIVFKQQTNWTLILAKEGADQNGQLVIIRRTIVIYGPSYKAIAATALRCSPTFLAHSCLDRSTLPTFRKYSITGRYHTLHQQQPSL